MILIVVPAVLFLDQLTKFLAKRFLTLHQPQPLIDGIVYLTLVYNRGAAFGILKDQLPVFVIASVFAVILIVRQLRAGHVREDFVYALSLALILSGALGNLIDRLLLGYVVDFVDLRFWPVFNVADSAISIGAALLAYSLLVRKDRKAGD